MEDIAREVLSAQDQALSLDPVTSRDNNFSIADAYAASDWIYQQRLEQGYTPVGRKIGFTNAAMWDEYGVSQPVWGWIYDKTLITSQHSELTESVICPLDRFTEPRIEPEVVVHFSSAPPATATAEELLQHIDWIAPGFEIVQSHFPGWKFKAADTIADGGLHAGLFIGKPLMIHQDNDNLIEQLKHFDIRLFCDSELIDTGKGENALDHPLKAVGHLLSVLADQQNAPSIQAGELITTGTLTAPYPVSAGQEWHATFSGIEFSEIRLRFEA